MVVIYLVLAYTLATCLWDMYRSHQIIRERSRRDPTLALMVLLSKLGIRSATPVANELYVRRMERLERHLKKL